MDFPNHKFILIQYVLKSNYQVIMLSYASKEGNHIAIMSNNSRVILRCIMTSLTLCCLVMTLSISLSYSSVVNKHQLLALSVLCLYCGINNGSRARFNDLSAWI